MDGDLAKVPLARLGEIMLGKELDAGMLNLPGRSFSAPPEVGADQEILPVFLTPGSIGINVKKAMYPLYVAKDDDAAPGPVTLGPVVVGAIVVPVVAAGLQEGVGCRKSRHPVSQGNINQAKVAEVAEVAEMFTGSTYQNLSPMAARVFGRDVDDFGDSGWDSDMYDDEEDVGYLREPIEDEETFLRTKIDYLSDKDKHISQPMPVQPVVKAGIGQADEAGDKERGIDVSPGADDAVYFSGEEYYQGSTERHEGGNGESPVGEAENLDGFAPEDSECTAERQERRRSQTGSASSAWAGLLRQMSKSKDRDVDVEGEEEIPKKHLLDGSCSLERRYLGPRVSDVAEHGSSMREGSSEGEGGSSRGGAEGGSFTGISRGSVGGQFGGSEVDAEEGRGEVARKLHVGPGSPEEQLDSYYQAAECPRANLGGEDKQGQVADSDRPLIQLTIRPGRGEGSGDGSRYSGLGGGGGLGDFSFPSPSSGGALSRMDSGRSLWSVGDQPPDKSSMEEGEDGTGVGLLSGGGSEVLEGGPDDTLASWKRKSGGNSPMALSPKHPLSGDGEGLGGEGGGGDGTMEGTGARLVDAEKRVARIVPAENTARLDLRAGEDGGGGGGSSGEMMGSGFDDDGDGDGDGMGEVDDFFTEGGGNEAGQSDALFGEVEFNTSQLLPREREEGALSTLYSGGGLGAFDLMMPVAKNLNPEAVKGLAEDEFVLVGGGPVLRVEEEGRVPLAGGAADFIRGAARVAEVGEGGGSNGPDQSSALETEILSPTPMVDEEEFEVFHLKVIHRKNRTGFEEEKDFPVLLNSVIAGRYRVTEFLGSAAFSKAIQARDMRTGAEVCMKIIKNNKDFFDQSLDEVKLLKYINRHDPNDEHHILRLYDFFYHREHLFIVCELLRANLYEFHKFNRESGGEAYFTMPRLQSITRQCLEALAFMHSLGLIHCDLKPENILMKSYSRCEIKVIDLGSSCFQTDHLCSYVQSRSYRAPEVILGLPYGQKIDIWSLGCILAELCSGQVLFQNDSLATLLARVVGILGGIDAGLLKRGRESHKYFARNGRLFERNPETDQLEHLIPKKTSLKHRLPSGDPGFVEFVRFLLTVDPNKRPTASEALKHPWMAFPYEPINA